MRAIHRSWGDVREVQGGWAGTSSEPSPPMTWPVMGHRPCTGAKERMKYAGLSQLTALHSA